MAVKPGLLVVVGAVILVLIFLLIIFLGRGSGDRTGRGVAVGFQDMADGGKFVLYYADWCPHCQSVKPEFKEFMQSGFVSVNGKKVAVDMVQPEKEPEKAAGVQVDGYPTFLYTDAAGRTVPYEGPRSASGWMAFLKEQVLA